MKLYRETVEIFIPDNTSLPAALERTTHLAIDAHQDDLEIMTAARSWSAFNKGTSGSQALS